MPYERTPFISFGRLLASRLVWFGVVVLFLLIPLAYVIVQKTFNDLETSYAAERLHFIEAFLLSEQRNLRVIAFDYANRPSAFDALDVSKSAFYKDNVRPDDLANVNIQTLNVYDLKQTLILSSQVSNPHKEILSVLLKKHILSRAPLAFTKNTGSPYYAWSSVHLIDAKPYPLLVAIAPVVSHSTVPEHGGWLVVTRNVNSSYLDLLHRESGMYFKIQKEYPNEKNFWIEVAPQKVLGARRLTESSDFFIRINLFPRWEIQRHRMFGSIMISAISILCILMLLNYVLLQRTLLGRLHTLTRCVKDIRFHTKNEMLPLQKKRTDEIDVLAGAINSMIEHISVVSAKLSHEALHDALTGLSNRRALLLTLKGYYESMLRGDPACIGLILLDLNGFKPINDTLGHAAGDAVLQDLASRFKTRCDDALHCHRLGGDEFAFVLHNACSQSLSTIAADIRVLIQQPLSYEGHIIHVDAALGLSYGTLDAPWTPDSLLRDADMAMYAEKKLS